VRKEKEREGEVRSEEKRKGREIECN